MRNNSLLWEQFSTQRDKIILSLRDKLSANMAALVGHAETADLLLVAADGRKLPAHVCILRQRAPVFFDRHVAPTLQARRGRRHDEPLEVAVGDVDSAGLAFFIRSVYTDEEICSLGGVQVEGAVSSDRDSPGPSQFHGSEQGDETPRNDQDSLDRSPTNGTSQRIPREHDSGFHTQSSDQHNDNEEPVLTSFRELATDSPMCLSNYSERSQYDIAEEDENEGEHRLLADHGRFIRLDDSGIGSVSQSISRHDSPVKQRRPSHTKIFPMFIGLNGDTEMTQSMPEPSLSASPYSSTNTLSCGSIRGRAMLARRLSVSSLTSLTSIDLTPTHETIAPVTDKLPCSRLAADLLEMYQKNVDTDTVIASDDGDLHAHKCILWATCPAFRKPLQKSHRIELRGFSRTSIDFLLSFLYGGLTSIPEDVEVWEIVSLATHLNIDELAQVAALHLKTQKCHFFHRPCATCVSAVFDALPQFRSIKCLNELFEEAMLWQARHFSRIWKGRVFLHLDEQWQRECRDALVADVNEESIIDTLLGCEKLQASLPRVKAVQLADTVQALVADVVEYCTDFLISSFDLIVGSKAFKSHGKGLALNLALLEDILPPLVHSLSAETAIKSFITLRDLLLEVQQENEAIQASPRRRTDGFQMPLNDWSQRFLHLVRRLFDSTDKHLLHYAFSVVKTDAYALLSVAERSRIEESGIFVEMRMPRAPPPRLSSFNRTYKRSSSVGVTSTPGKHDRTRSLERSRPIISQVVEASEREELAREKSFFEIHRRTSSLRERSDRPPPSTTAAGASSATPPTVSDATTTTAPSKQTEKPSSRNVSPASRIPAPTTRQVSPRGPRTSQQSPQRSGTNPVKKGPPPTRRPAMPVNPEDVVLERQVTQTIMTVQQHKESGVDPQELGMPQVLDSPKAKPKSVVRPMPKNTSLAASSPAAAILPPSTSKSSRTELRRPNSARSSGSGVSAESKSAANSTPATQRPKPRSAVAGRATAASSARAVGRRVPNPVESKIPKVRALN